jgi:hypothetical protein
VPIYILATSHKDLTSGPQPATSTKLLSRNPRAALSEYVLDDFSGSQAKSSAARLQQAAPVEV